MTHREKQKLIERFVKPDVLKSAKTIWGREMKLLNELVLKYPDDIFWQRFETGFSLHSLAWFKTPDGEREISNRFKTFHLDIPTTTSYDLKADKVGEDYKATEPKKKSIADILQAQD
jgi:hypothetical protein